DQLFGRCQRVPVIDVYRYEVSPPVLQSLRSLLHKLTHRGLTWQDDTTQQVISKELSKLQKIYYRRPDTSYTDTDSQPRAGIQGVDSERNDGKNGEANLGKSLQQYLQYLGFIPQSTAQTNQKAKNEKPPVKSDAIQADRFIDYIRQKSKTRGKAPPSIFSLAPSLQTQYPDNTTPPRPFVPFQLERAPDQLGAVDFPSKQSMASKALLSTLEGYLAKKIASQQTPDVQPKGPLVYNSRLRQPTTSQVESMSPSEDVDSYKGKKPLQPKPDSWPQRPQSDRLTYKTGLKQETAKDPLSFMDESFIENVVKKLGKHSVNMDGLSPKELDQLADVIADALQVLDQGDTNPQEMKRVSAPSMEEYENDMIGEDDMMQGANQCGISHSTLDTDTGLHLMEVLAHHLKLQMKDFVDVEYNGT
ncbi:UNVERIFIED_CONTAM: hypothetical protein FKN15_031408, partial [Acipenser sinensis]